MEVHHHPEIEKKGFKEYILEGLMIFIAVMMGFFAEGIRENITAKEHVEQLCRGLLQDLKADTAQLDKLITSQKTFIKNDDSLILMLQQPLAAMDKTKFQQLVYNTFSVNGFNISTGYISAIKNELHLKQFANSKITGYIGDYEGEASNLKKAVDLEVDIVRSHIDPFITEHFTMLNTNAFFFSKDGKVTDPRIRNLTQDDLDKLGVGVAFVKLSSANALMHQKASKNKAVVLIDYIKKQYKLEDE